MNHLTRFKRQATIKLIIALLLPGITSLAVFLLLFIYLDQEQTLGLLVAFGTYIGLSVASILYLRQLLLQPISTIWQAIWHISPNKESVAAPNLDNLAHGRELVSSLVLQMYNLVHAGGDLRGMSENKGLSETVNTLIDNIPAALYFIKSDMTISGTNSAGLEFLNLEKSAINGKNIYDVLRMSFSKEETLDKWLNGVVNNKVKESKSWQRVKITLDDGKTVKYFDMSASYSKNSSSGNDIVLAIYDKTAGYAELDKSVSYVAMAVHELRTPLTLMRGYIEVFEDELGDKLTPELTNFMHKMRASAQTLTAFVNNILNMARIDEDQLTLSLQEADWETTLKEITSELNIRASVRHKSLELEIEPNLPKVAIDKISMYEVINNLVDNAIKYSGQSPRIIIRAKTGKEGGVHTEVQDFGAGIPPSVIGSLFTRYYRSHRSKNAISGSGIGLYLVKAIVTAHGGNVWVNSKEGQGSTFGFSLQKFDSIKDPANNDGIERQASGWIKNHSLYRR